MVKVRAVGVKMGKPGRWDLCEARIFLFSMLQWDGWLLQLRCFGVDVMFLSLFSKISPSSPWDQTLSQVYGASLEESTWRAESFQLTILPDNGPWTSIAKWCQTSGNLLVSEAVTEVTMSPNCTKKLSASCEEPQRRLLEKLVLYITDADGPVLGTLHKRRFSNVLQISDYFKLCYPNEPQPAISCSCLHSRVLVHETKRNRSTSYSALQRNCRKECKTSSIKRIRLSTWSGKLERISKRVIQHSHFLITHLIAHLFSKVRKQPRKGKQQKKLISDTFSRLKNLPALQGAKTLAELTVVRILSAHNCSYIDFHKPKENPFLRYPDWSRFGSLLPLKGLRP